jgi:hypothetical protein
LAPSPFKSSERNVYAGEPVGNGLPGGGSAAEPVAIGNKQQLTAARAVRSAPEVLESIWRQLGVLDNMHLAISESEKAQDSFCMLAFH